MQIATLAARHAVPAIYQLREFAAAGGLMSYGPALLMLSPGRHLYRPDPQGREAGRLAGEQSAKFELVINLKTARRSASKCRHPARPRRRGDRMRRREFITLLGGAAAAWPLAARAQQPERDAAHRRAGGRRRRGRSGSRGPQRGVPARAAAIGLDRGPQRADRYRWGLGNADNIRKYAAELAALAPDVILASGTSTMAPLLQATRTVPIVFVNVADPVGAGFVDSLARPGGNATGFMQFEYSLSGKWLELLKEIAPGVTRAAVLRDPAITAGIGQFAVIQSVAPSVGVEVSPVNVRDAGEIERAVAAFARSPNGGLIVTASALALLHRDLIITLAARHKIARGLLPTTLRHRRRPDLLWV